jgi:hypothetical protein
MGGSPMTFPQMESALELAAAEFAPIEASVQALNSFGRRLYVDPVSGSDTNNGTAWSTGFKTMAHAIEVCDVYDIIGFAGTIKEDSLTLATPSVVIVGLGPDPAANVWQQADVYAASKTLLNVTAINCAMANMKIRPPAYLASGVPKGIALSGAYQFKFFNNLVQGRAGSYFGLYTDGNNANVRIKGNRFLYINTADYGIAIGGGGYTVGENSGWVVEDNFFHSNLNHIVARMRQSFIIRNHFAAGGLAADGSNSATLTVLGIDIHGATGGNNVVTQNFLGSLYDQACYYGGTNDAWAGNFCQDRTHATQVDATTGISKVVPAAA